MHLSATRASASNAAFSGAVNGLTSSHKNRAARAPLQRLVRRRVL